MHETEGNRDRATTDVRRKIIIWCLQSVVGLVGYGVIIFLAAGTVKWLWGWLFLASVAVMLFGQPILLVPISPETFLERAGGLRQEGGKRWDRWLAAVAGGILPMASWIVAGLNLRYNWQPTPPALMHVVGLVLVAIGWFLFLWAMASNAYFSEVVRIQAERGHAVATNGPYRVVRHPGYAGAILAFLGVPFLLGSYWALIPAVLGMAGYVLRTALEDRTLQDELGGYREYCSRVRYRLLPGIW
ncbi:MAG: isoprenylcysteine carboxylmethyltransferase family protein [Anaerolineales bacterium]|jgi:protein-S-isoprenylcysteine O-methyltransferase Ste14